jgi:hypothetical protein
MFAAVWPALAIAGVSLAGAVLAAPAPPVVQPYRPPHLFLSPSGEPFRAAPEAPDPVQTWFAGADTGHLGYLDRAEFRADAARFFKKLDENGDGIIDGFEVADYEHKVAPELVAWSEGIPVNDTEGGPGDRPGGDGGGGHEHHGGGHGGPPGGRDGGGGGHGAGGGDGGRGPRNRTAPMAQLITDPEPVMAADFNFDSHISMDEWMRVTDVRFDVLDEAHTGKLTVDVLHQRLSHSNQPAPPHHEREPQDNPQQQGQPPQQATAALTGADLRYTAPR